MSDWLIATILLVFAYILGAFVASKRAEKEINYWKRMANEMTKIGNEYSNKLKKLEQRLDKAGKNIISLMELARELSRK